MVVVRVALALCSLATSFIAAAPAPAAEYRLQIANLYRSSFSSFFDGPIGKGAGELTMPRLQQALDAGSLPWGALLTDRTFRYGWDDLAKGFGAVKVRGFVTPAEGTRRWDEAVWDGVPGERSVWVIAASTTHWQEVFHTAIKGTGDDTTLRYYVPYDVSARPKPEPVVAYQLPFLRFYSDRGTLWSRYLTKSVSLGEGIAAVVGVNSNPTFADWVYFVVDHPPTPTVFKAVIGWDRRRSADRSNIEGGGARDH